MVQYFPYLLLLMVAIMLLIMLANRLKVAYPILLVLGGLAISLIPNVPTITLNPDLVLIIFLPPLLYADVFSLSLKEMWKWRRIIFSFAFIVVFITAAAVAWVANMVFPGFSLALGFLLGGVIGSTDAVSASAIMNFVKVPKRISTIIESESLLNDASSLIVFRFAALVVTTGQLVWTDMALNFLWVVVAGSLIGLAIAWVMSKMYKYLPTDANMDVILSVIAPYIMYIVANEMGASGVLAVVAGGMYMSLHLTSIFAASTRNKGVAVWDILGFILNGLAFMLIGLALPEVLEGYRSRRYESCHCYQLRTAHHRGSSRGTTAIILWSYTHYSSNETLYHSSRQAEPWLSGTFGTGLGRNARGAFTRSSPFYPSNFRERRAFSASQPDSLHYFYSDIGNPTGTRT